MSRFLVNALPTQRSNSSRWSLLSATALCSVVMSSAMICFGGCSGTEDVAKEPETVSSQATLKEQPTEKPVEPVSRKKSTSTPIVEDVAVTKKTPDPTPTSAEPPVEPPVEPVVTVDETPRPPATVEQAAKLLDLRTFPVLKGANIPGQRQSIGDLYYSAPDDVDTAFKFQCEELKKIGWQELPGTRPTGQNPAATFTQQGFIVSVSVSSFGQGPNGETGWSSNSLHNHGNVLTNKLPVPDGAEPRYTMLIQASYVTKESIAETAKSCKELLVKAGWNPYGENEHKSPVSNSHLLSFKQNAVLLSANISDHSNQPGLTFISYSTVQLTADIPKPPGDPDFRYSDSNKRMHFDTKDSAQDVAAYYVAELGKLGWKPTTDQLIVNDAEREAMMVFRNEAEDRIDLDIDIFDGLSRVNLKHFTPAEIEELDRQMKALAEERKREAAQAEVDMAERRKALTYEFPIPNQAKEFDLEEDGDGLMITMPGGTGAAALTVLRTHFLKAGWKEDSFSSDGPAGSLTVSRGDSKLWISFINIDQEDDFELDVTCFSAYVKPKKK